MARVRIFLQKKRNVVLKVLGLVPRWAVMTSSHKCELLLLLFFLYSENGNKCFNHACCRAGCSPLVRSSPCRLLFCWLADNFVISAIADYWVITLSQKKIIGLRIETGTQTYSRGKFYFCRVITVSSANLPAIGGLAL